MPSFSSFELRLSPRDSSAQSQSPLPIQSGQQVELAWSVSGADFVKIVVITADPNGGPATTSDAAGPFNLKTDAATFVVGPAGACRYQILAAAAQADGTAPADWSQAALGPTVEITLAPPTTTTAAKPAPTTTAHPPTTTTAPHPATTTTAAHPATTTTATHPASTTTAAHPATTTTAQPATTTTAHPASTTTAAQPATTTTVPPGTTTSGHPGTTTSAQPGTTTSAAPATTTSAHPGSTTTGNPGSTTTAQPGTTTTAPPDGPTINSFDGAVDPDDGNAHDADSLQVEVGASVVLTWTLTNADDGVELSDSSATTDPQKLDANTLTAKFSPSQPTQDYTLVAIKGTERSQPKVIHVSTHAPGDVVSAHASVTGPPAIATFTVIAKGGDASTAANTATIPGGAQMTFAWTVSGDVGTLAIDQSVGDALAASTTQQDGTRTGTLDAPLTAPTDGTTSVVFTLTLQASDNSVPAVTSQVTVTVGPSGVKWSADTVGSGDDVSMQACGFPPSAQVQFEVTQVGFGVISTPDPIAADSSGTATLGFTDWLAPQSITAPVDLPDGQDFVAVTYTFTAKSGDQTLTSAAPITYSDSLQAQFVADDNTPYANTAYQLISPWGTKAGTTDAQGNITLDHLPPGGVRLTLAGDVLTATDAQQ